jgi:hypothetical protein
MSKVLSIDINGVIFKLNDIVSYTMENADPSSATGHIKKFNIDVDPRKNTILIGHSNLEGKTISINQPNLRLDPDSQPTPAPVKYLQKKTSQGVAFGEKFKVGETVSYFMAYSDPSPAIGKINKIEPKTGLLEIKHKDIIITININGAGHDVTHTSDAETPPPTPMKYIDKVVSGGNVRYSQGDTIRYILKNVKDAALAEAGPKASPEALASAIAAKYSVGKIISVDAKNNSLLVEHPKVDGSDGFDTRTINIGTSMEKVNAETPRTPAPPKKVETPAGSKKYTLEEENKYRLKYAKYKAKYLLLK